MATTRAQAVTKIREILRDWYRDNDTLGAALSGSLTSRSATVNSGTRHARGDKWQIGDEVLDVVSVSGNTVVVRRARFGTNVSAHASASTTVNIASPGGYTDHEIKQAIIAAEDNIFPGSTREFVGSIGGTAKLNLDDADQTTSWSALGENGAVATDTTDYKEGIASLKYAFNYSSTGSGSQRKTINAKDTRPYSYLNLWVYTGSGALKGSNGDSALKTDWSFDVRLGTSASVFRSRRIANAELGTGWNLLSIPISDMTDTTTSTAMSAITRIELKSFADQSITATDLKFDAWWLTTYPIVKTGLQRYTNPKNVVNVRKIFIDGSEELRFQADQYGFELETDAVNEAGIGTPLLVIGQRRPEPSSDTQNIDVTNEARELVYLYAAQKLIEGRVVSRTNFESFSGKKNIADITTAELITVQNNLVRRIKDIEQRIFQPGRHMPMK